MRHHCFELALVFIVGVIWCPRSGADERAAVQPGGREPSGGSLKTAQTRFAQKIKTVRWVAYMPTTFVPGRHQAIRRADVEADFKVLLESGFTGVVTYGCTPTRAELEAGKKPPKDGDIGLDELPAVARAVGFDGFIFGVWDPKSRKEREAAKAVANQGLIDAICVGNEGLDDRYEWDELRDAMRDLREKCLLPVATTEQIEDYSLVELRNPSEVDFILPNVHCVFQQEEDPIHGAEWTIEMLQAVVDLVKNDGNDIPILSKEQGWPSQGLDQHDEALQQTFWTEFDKLARKSGLPYVVFEAFDQPWKHEKIQDADVGPHWGIFTVDRQPKPVAKKAPWRSELPK